MWDTLPSKCSSLKTEYWIDVIAMVLIGYHNAITQWCLTHCSGLSTHWQKPEYRIQYSVQFGRLLVSSHGVLLCRGRLLYLLLVIIDKIAKAGANKTHIESLHSKFHLSHRHTKATFGPGYTGSTVMKSSRDMIGAIYCKTDRGYTAENSTVYVIQKEHKSVVPCWSCSPHEGRCTLSQENSRMV